MFFEHLNKRSTHIWFNICRTNHILFELYGNSKTKNIISLAIALLKYIK